MITIQKPRAFLARSANRLLKPWVSSPMHRSTLAQMGYRYKVHLATCRSQLMSWSKPAYIDLRIGFEVTMYFANR